MKRYFICHYCCYLTSIAALSNNMLYVFAILTLYINHADNESRGQGGYNACKKNVLIALLDELTLLFHDIFSDSEIAKKFSSRHTKTACIINGSIAPHYQQQLVESMKKDPFALAIDGSNDSGVEKMNPLNLIMNLALFAQDFWICACLRVQLQKQYFPK